MATCIIVKGNDGKLVGLGQKGGRAYARWQTAVASLEVGETLSFEWKKPRSPKFHRMFFAMLGELFDRQEKFTDSDQMRLWLIVGAGYCDFVPGLDGKMVALPRSIRWEAMDENEFCEVVLSVWEFIRSPHAQRFLWPHLPPAVAAETVEYVLIGAR